MRVPGILVILAGMVFGLLGSNDIRAAELREQPTLPIVLQPLRHEEELFGYHPWFVRNEVSFDSLNRPYIRSRDDSMDETGFIQTLRDGRWVELDFTEAVRAAYPTFEAFTRGGGRAGARIVFDADEHLYTYVQIRVRGGSLRNVLLYSTDYGESFQVYELPSGDIDMEHFVGHNSLDRPPLMVTFRRRAEHSETYAGYYDLFILQPEKLDGSLYLPEPIHVTGDALPLSRHSGHPSFAVSAGERTFFTWFEARPTNDLAGAPTYVSAYDTITKSLGPRYLLAYAPPANDGHNTPGMCIDPSGYLHLISGAHGDQFFHLTSLEPYTTDAGWTEPAPTMTTGWREGSSERGRQTYVGFSCDTSGTLHLVFRQWRRGVDPYFPGQYFGALAYQQKAPGQPWSEPRILVVPPVPNYSIYYHKLSIDRLGRLFLSYSYRSSQEPYGVDFDNAAREHPWRSMLMSDDGGTTWRIPTTEDFATGVLAGDDGTLRPGTIKGVVTDLAGPPLAGAQVSPRGWITTDDEGRFTLGPVYVDTVTLMVEKEGYYPHREEISLRESPTVRVAVQLRPVLEQDVELADLAARNYRSFAELGLLPGRMQIHYTRRIGGSVSFDLDYVDASRTYQGVRFEARNESARGTTVNVMATAHHSGGSSTQTLVLRRVWDTYEIRLDDGALHELTLGLVGSDDTKIAIRNVKVLY